MCYFPSVCYPFVPLYFTAGYCVVTYLLGVGDRHMDNLLVTNTGILRIDAYVVGLRGNIKCLRDTV